MTEEVKTEDTSVDETETQIYEVGFHIVSSVSEDSVSVEAEAVKSLIEKSGGVFIADEFPKKISLAYTITKEIEGKKQRFDTAYFGWIKFEMKTDSIINLKEGMEANKNILRFLIIKTVKESTLAPKTIVFAKDDSPRKTTRSTGSGQAEGTVKKADKAEKPKPTPVSEEELDKTIEELIVE